MKRFRPEIKTKYRCSTCIKHKTRAIIALITSAQSHRKTSWRIRGHSQLQREHEALEELLRQLWDLFRKDLTDEGDKLVVLITQRRELE